MKSIDHLIGIKFKQGSDDCYGLARTFYKEQFDIDLPNIARPEAFWEKDIDLFGQYYEQLGFFVIDLHSSKWQVGDVAMMAFRTKYASHCGIYIGNNEILHHLYNTISRTDRYAGDWKNLTVYMLRHKDVKAVEAQTSTDMMDLLLPSVREKVNAGTE